VVDAVIDWQEARVSVKSSPATGRSFIRDPP